MISKNYITSLIMRTQDYGRLHSLDIIGANGLFCKIPITMNTSERWVCHAIYPSFHDISEYSCYLVLVDNYGELYYFLASRHYSEIWIYDTIKDVSLKQNLICESKTKKDFAFSNNFIDILKSTYIPFDSFRFEGNKSKKKPTIGIENYIDTLQKKNKRIIDEYDKIVSYTPYEIPFKSSKDYYEGLLDQTNGILVIKYVTDTNFRYDDLMVYSSWNDWEFGFDVKYYKDKNTDEEFLYITLYLEDVEEIQQGKHHYKFKRGDTWIEPNEYDLKEKSGNIWNNVLFIHESLKELDWTTVE